MTQRTVNCVTLSNGILLILMLGTSLFFNCHCLLKKIISFVFSSFTNSLFTANKSVILANFEFMLLDVSELLVWSLVKVLSLLSRVVSSAYII